MMIRFFSLSAFLISLTCTQAQFGFERIDTINVVNGGDLELPWAGGLNYPQFSNIDLNFDGVQDLFVFDRTSDRVLTFIHNGGTTASYTYDPTYESVFPQMEKWALLVDYNCDGLMDIYTHTIGGGRVFKNIGDSGSGHSFELVVSNLKTWIWGSESFMYISAVDMPAITDMDGDGDIDILAFSVNGRTIEYHKNMSMENYGVCDSLAYETLNLCWGRFTEDANTNLVTLYDTLDYPCNGPLGNEESWRPYVAESEGGDRHAGSTILALDMDANGVMELVLGDISYPNLTLLTNGGTTPNTNSAMIAQDPNFPSNTTQAFVDVHPAAFYLDLNNDGIRDLVAAPSSTVGSENRKGIFHYDNLGADDMPTFDYVEKGFLQNDMIEVGSGAYPVFFDHNADGLMDLLVSSLGQFDSITHNQVSKIAYYENTGTSSNPEFTFVTDDYMNLSSQGIGNSLMFYPTFGDLDNDGDEDMILGEYTGYCYYMENTGGAGNPAIFNTFFILNDNTSNPIFEGTFVYPNLVDLDKDGDLDLVNGKRDGKLSYFENVGNANVFLLSEVTTNLGNVDVSEYWNIEGHSIPQFIDIDNEWELVLGSLTGDLHYYTDIEGNLGGSFTLVDSTLEDINIGEKSAPAVADITGDNKLEMVLGNLRGGVGLYKSAPISNIGFVEHEMVSFKVYPNPATTTMTIELGSDAKSMINNGELELLDLSGRVVYKQSIQQTIFNIDLKELNQGVYFVKIQVHEKSAIQRFVKQ